LLSVLLFLSILAVYGQVSGHGFVNYDDNLYVTGNSQVQRGLTWDGVVWAFATLHGGNWHPLTWLSHMTDVQLFGLDAGWHHRVNVLFHGLNTVILFLVLKGMTGAPGRSFFVAALFGVHPLHVESVAWVAERKDLLSTLFWLSTMGAYLRYVRRPTVPGYLSVAVFFALGLLSKPMLVTLPFALLLFDWWPLGRIAAVEGADRSRNPSVRPALSRVVREKIPLLALSAASCVVTYIAQLKGGSVSGWEESSLGLRSSNALVSYLVYLDKAVWPSSLAVFYPFSRAGFPAWKVAGAALLLAVVSAAAVWQARRRPYFAVGWFWYVGTLVPVIGLVQVGSQAYADRYTYLPLIGLFIAVLWGAPEALERLHFRRQILGAAGAAALLALAAASFIQVGYWKDDFSLFSHARDTTTGNWLAHNNMGDILFRQGRIDEAIAEFREAVRIMPDFVDGRCNLAYLLALRERKEEAIDQYREVLRERPDFSIAHNNLGDLLLQKGETDEAILHFREALRYRPDDSLARDNLERAVREKHGRH